ncbi:MAG: hypothetical protein ABIP51_18850 [Bacteroidia bacterium]
MKYSKDKILDIGIEKLKNFGFVHVNKKNILEDEVYKYYFKRFISFIIEQDENIDKSIKELFSSIDKKINESTQKYS